MRIFILALCLALLPVVAGAELTEWTRSFSSGGKSVVGKLRVANRAGGVFQSEYGSVKCAMLLLPARDGSSVDWTCSDGTSYVSRRSAATKMLTVYRSDTGLGGFRDDDSFWAWAHDLAVQAVP